MDNFSRKEWEVINCIIELTERLGFPPTVREMQAALGYRSTSTVHHYMKRLAAAKAISYEPSKPRTIIVLAPMKSRQKSDRKPTESLLKVRPVRCYDRYAGR